MYCELSLRLTLTLTRLLTKGLLLRPAGRLSSDDRVEGASAMQAAALELRGVAGDLAGALVLFAGILSVFNSSADSWLVWVCYSTPAVGLGWKKSVYEVIVNLSALPSRHDSGRTWLSMLCPGVSGGRSHSHTFFILPWHRKWREYLKTREPSPCPIPSSCV